MEKIRAVILWIAILVLLAIASFEGGYILRDRQKDDTRERIFGLSVKFRDHDGRITMLEGSKPEGPKKPKK